MKRLFSIAIAAATAISCLADVPRGEYPRPQFERTDWVNLNGKWSMKLDPGKSGDARNFKDSLRFSDQIIVPFVPESELSGVNHKDFIPSIWYQREIVVPQDWNGKRVRLNFGAAYYETEIFVNGRFVGRHYGGSDPFSFDITDYLKLGEPNNLVVNCLSNVRDGKQPAGKQSVGYYSAGCNYTRSTGIWQTVWLEPVDPAALENARVVPNIDNGTLSVTPRFYNLKGGERFRVDVLENGKKISSGEVSAAQNSPVILKLKNAKLWSPESPYLYDLKYTVTDASGKVLDEVEGYTGMRKIHIDGNKIYLNNKPYYQRLVLDQGFYPDGIWTAPSDEALRRDIEMSKEAGFNGARLHQKVFEERYHYWADKLGYLVWGEMPSWGMNPHDAEAGRNFLSEWGNVVERDRNHPALIVWTPFNEIWSTPTKEEGRLLSDAYDLTKKLDPTRPVNTVSGGIYVKSDFCTAHSYEQDGAKLEKQLYSDGKFYQPQGPRRVPEGSLIKLEYKGDVPYILDEFGGIKCAEANPSKKNAWGYGDAAPTKEDFYKRLDAQVKAILAHSDKICGFCYTQLTDVEQEQNGVYYYDRGKKYDMKRVKEIFQQEPSK